MIEKKPLSPFQRTELILGKEKLTKLQKSFVVIVGLGAVGGYTLEALARMGIDSLRLVDFDQFEESNLNRQILATQSTIGLKKTEVAKNRVLEINPNCKIETCELFYNEKNSETILGKGFKKIKPDLIIDAIDPAESKASLLIECLKREIPVISSMGAALRTDSSYIKIKDLMETQGCALAKQIRKLVRKSGFGKGVLCVYSEEPLKFNFKDKFTIEKNKLGSLPTITGIFGLTLANLAIKKLTSN